MHSRFPHPVRFVFALLAGTLMFGATAYAQQQPTADEVAALTKRINELEARLKAVEAQQNAVKAAPADTINTNQPQTATQAASSSQPMDMGMSAHGMSPDGLSFGQMKIRGFGDVGWHDTTCGLRQDTFALGQFDLFITSRLSDTTSILAETVVEADQTNAVGIDLERLLLQYQPNEYLNLSVGRYHSAIGYYNTAYHHSAWMQTAIGRPFMFAFEDGGGILPVHNVGVSATGKIPSGALGLHYIAEVGNGRASRTPLDEAVQNVVDENLHKSVNFGFLVKPPSWSGFEGGFDVYHDRLTPEAFAPISETIYTGHVVFISPVWEFLNEAAFIAHTPEDTHRTFFTPIGYTQVSRRFGSYRPYFRYQYVNANVVEPIFSDVQMQHGPSFGLRYSATEYTALKVEYGRNMTRNQPATNSVGLQASFTF